jgi:hypothetical protein
MYAKNGNVREEAGEEVGPKRETVSIVEHCQIVAKAKEIARKTM